MTVTPGNFCAKAMEDLKRIAGNPAIDFGMRVFAGRIVLILQSAVKFHLPDNGLISDNYRVMPERFRLPYPVTAIEYRVTLDSDLNEVPIALRSNGKLTGSRDRIGLAIEVLPESFDAFSYFLPASKASQRLPEGYMAVIPIFLLEATNLWTFPAICMAVSLRRFDDVKRSPFAEEVYGKTSGVTLPFKFEPFAASDAIVRQEIARGNIDDIRASIFQDNGDEVRAILDLIQILSCANVKTSEIDPPAKLNKARVKAGKQPFFSYKVLELAGGADGEAGAGGGTHASPRVHLRRGHIRRLPSKNIWVNAAVVGNPKRGMVQKDYAVKVA